MTDYKREFVLLRTKKGTANNKEELKEMWKERIEKIAPHYEIVAVELNEIQ